MMGQSSRQAGIAPTVVLQTRERRRPFRCSRGQPCRIETVDADALKLTMVAPAALVLVAEQALPAVVEAASCSPAEAGAYTSAFESIHSELEVDSSKAGQAHMVDNMAVGQKAEVGNLVHEWLVLVCQTAAFRFAVAVVGTDIVAVVRSMAAVAAGTQAVHSCEPVVGSGKAAAPLVHSATALWLEYPQMIDSSLA